MGDLYIEFSSVIFLSSYLEAYKLVRCLKWAWEKFEFLIFFTIKGIFWQSSTLQVHETMKVRSKYTES